MLCRRLRDAIETDAHQWTAHSKGAHHCVHASRRRKRSSQRTRHIPFWSAGVECASDWSRYPLGTRFRLADTSEEYVIDDYGNALVGTDSIDLFKNTRSEVKNWGVRYVDIDILQWGSEEESLKVLAPRCKHNCVRKMVAALEKKKSKTVAQNTPRRTSASN